MTLRVKRSVVWLAICAAFAVTACHGNGSAVVSNALPAAAPAYEQNPAAMPGASDAPPAVQTGGFDGAEAYAQTAKLVSFGPRPPGSDAIRKSQDYIHQQLTNFGCLVDEDSFNAQTPIGTLPMKNIIAKAPGTGQGIILLLTHYDTLRLDGFVGADDGGSSTGLMLEMARALCAQKPSSNAVWIAFLDGEEAQLVQSGVAQWTDSDSVFGSRELAAKLAVAGDLKRVRAVILADMVGQYNLEIRRDSESTAALTDLVWSTAKRLGYGKTFSDQKTSVDDDHGPFVKRGLPAVDIIDLGGYAYWHTPQDTMDKISAHSLAIVGHVIIATVDQLQKLGPGKRPG